MAKLNRPTWFRIFYHQAPIFQFAPAEALGNAVKAAMRYFDTGEIPPMTEVEQLLFTSLRESVDESYADYHQNVENGKKGGRPRSKKTKQPNLPGAASS